MTQVLVVPVEWLLRSLDGAELVGSTIFLDDGNMLPVIEMTEEGKELWRIREEEWPVSI